jgi:universal stress protein A
MKIYQHIVCATDFSPFGDAACRRAAELGNVFASQVSFLHVVENFPEDRSNEVITPEDIDPAIYREKEAYKLLSTLTATLEYKDSRQQVLMSMEPAWREIVNYSKNNHADLIILGSHGKHGLSSPLGSTANGVVNHAACDVLAVRAAASPLLA